MVLWFPLVLILSSVQAQVTESVITSIHQMEILYRSERSFVAQMSEFAHQLTLLSDSIKAYKQFSIRSHSTLQFSYFQFQLLP